ncbi:MAG: hypothetical protein Q9227_002991 [Pyrenula ochraceoflavens]
MALTISVGRRLAYAFILYMFVISASSKVLPTPAQKSVSPPSTNDVLSDLRSQYNLPCLAAATSDNNSFVKSVTGLRKYGADIAVRPNDPFHLGSLTKAMTATLLAIVIKNGSLTWDTTLSEALPSLSAIMNPAHRSTTLRMLTSHRSGISIDWPTADPLFWFSLFRRTAYSGRQQITLHTLTFPPSFSRGTFTYDNTNFIIAGRIIDLALNSTWESALTTYLFTPLHMSSCGLGPNPESNHYLSIDSPWPHTMLTIPTGRHHSSSFYSSYHRPLPLDYLPYAMRDNPPALNSAGRVHCPLESYNNFLRAHADGGAGLPTLLSELDSADWRELHTPWPDEGDEEHAPVLYSPGAWNVIPNDNDDGDESQQGEGGYDLTHTGSNTYNYAMAWVSTGRGRRKGGGAKTFVSATNVGDEGALEAVGRVVEEMRRGRRLLGG